MVFYAFKIIVTIAIIILVAEISKRSTLFGGLIASLPLISFLSFIWLYVDTKDTDRIAELSMQIFWLVIPSLLFFVVFAWLIKLQFSFVISMAAATIIMFIGYSLTLYLLKQFA